MPLLGTVATSCGAYRSVRSAPVPRRHPSAIALLVSATALAAASACAGDDGDERLGEDRAAQVRAAADEAGLADDVGEVLALAARGTTATFRVTYAGTGGAAVVVSQRPPDRRIDIVVGEATVESRVVRDGISYVCRPEGQPAPDARLACQRGDAATDAPGVFTPQAIEAFTASLVAGAGELELTVEERTIADTVARCLVAAPAGGTTLDGSEPGPETICLSPEGAQLLTDAGGERVVADSYSTDVPEGTFEI